MYISHPMSKLLYFQEIPISYENDEEYQQCILALLSLQPIFDEHSSNTIELFLDMVYEEIKDNSYICELCLLAANTMYVEDIQLGLVLLFSYEYLQKTHALFLSYLQEGTSSISFMEQYQQFKTMLTNTCHSTK
jgi:hypothetical protein